jgi:hypothetical protein
MYLPKRWWDALLAVARFVRNFVGVRGFELASPLAEVHIRGRNSLRVAKSEQADHLVMFAFSVRVAPRVDDCFQFDESPQSNHVVQVDSSVPEYEQMTRFFDDAGARECALKDVSKGRGIRRGAASKFGRSRCRGVLAFVCDQLAPCTLNGPQLQPSARHRVELVALMQEPLV